MRKNGLVQIVHFTNALSTLIDFNFLTIDYRNYAWVADVAVGANNVHPWAECSNRGICDRSNGYYFESNLIMVITVNANVFLDIQVSLVKEMNAPMYEVQTLLITRVNRTVLIMENVYL